MLKEQFIALLKSFDTSDSTIKDLWNEIETCYAETNRHYHTIEHLEHLHQELIGIKDSIEDWEVLIFSIVYHDIIYNVRKSDNELRSAEFAENRIQNLGIPKEKIVKCKEQIIATRSHKLCEDSDTNYFLDADLSVLGSSHEKYEKYTRDIREEFRFYPDILYKQGRKKVIRDFLAMDRIYKTSYFCDLYEIRARENLQWELKYL
jgi:predicted metal-dependent HD superfamily phosphohydrolase